MVFMGGWVVEASLVDFCSCTAKKLELVSKCCKFVVKGARRVHEQVCRACLDPKDHRSAKQLELSAMVWS